MKEAKTICAERSDPKVMSMHKELSVKSRVRGDFHARSCERVRVKLPRSTRPLTPYIRPKPPRLLVSSLISNCPSFRNVPGSKGGNDWL